MNNRLKITAYLNGGIGNQMFQYAAARSLSHRNGAKLILDQWSGFIRDHKYKRSFELSSLPIQARLTNPSERIPIWLKRIHNRMILDDKIFHESRLYGDFLNEIEQKYVSDFEMFKIKRNTWLVGYWQSPLYFQNHKEILHKELMPPSPRDKRLLALGLELEKSNSLALGIRLYEESSNPEVHAHKQKSKSIHEINKVLEEFYNYNPEAKTFIFCTHRSPLLKELVIPSEYQFVTGEDVLGGALETLWLLTRCRHHIFTNSSYYWWGAWLSNAIRGSEGQYINAADNFINQDAYCESWKKF